MNSELIDIYAEGLAVMEPRSDYDQCIIGVVTRFNQRFILYSQSKVIEHLMSEGLTYDEAVEHWDFNMNGGWIGDDTWGFLEDLDLEAT